MSQTISIVTPSFNQGSFLEECIRSVVSQKGDFFIDYIIIDGGSTDNSVGIIKKYEHMIAKGQWPVGCNGIRYRWLSEADRGQADAINRGFGMSEGEIVAWINSDDYYLPGAFASAVKYLQNDSSIAMLYGDGYVVDKEGNEKLTYRAEPLFDLWKLIHLYDFILQPSAFIRRQALERAGFLDERLHYILDWELWIRLSRFGKILYMPARLSCARVYSGTKTESAGMERWKEIKWCSRNYGHMKWAPAIFTQFFHRPLRLALKDCQEGKHTFLSYLVDYLRKIYYPLIRENSSGIYNDGYVERVGTLSLPLRNEVSKVIITIVPVCINTLRYFINNRYYGMITLNNAVKDLEIPLKDELKRDYMHIKFKADGNVDIAPLQSASLRRKSAFKIQNIFLQKEDGEKVENIGLPEFSL